MAWGVIAADVIIPAAQYAAPAGAYADQINGAAAAAGPFWRKTRVEERTTCNYLRLGTTMTLAGTVVGGVAVPAAALANADTGGLATAAADFAAGQNRNGIAANFGAGRGLWNQGHVDALLIAVRETTHPGVVIAGAAGERYNAPQPLTHLDTVALATADLRLVFQNYGAVGGAAGVAGDVLSTPEIAILWVPPQAR